MFLIGLSMGSLIAVQLAHDRPELVRGEVAGLARDGHFHLLRGLGHGSAFGHRPDVVNACLRSIVDGYAYCQ